MEKQAAPVPKTHKCGAWNGGTISGRGGQSGRFDRNSEERDSEAGNIEIVEEISESDMNEVPSPFNLEPASYTPRVPIPEEALDPRKLLQEQIKMQRQMMVQQENFQQFMQNQQREFLMNLQKQQETFENEDNVVKDL